MFEEPPYPEFFTYTPADKKAFAAALLRYPSEPLKAAYAVFGSEKANIGKCSYIAAYWPNDHEVAAASVELLSKEGVKNFLPTKEELARRLWEWTEKGPYDERIKAAKLLAEVMDFMPKANDGTTVHIHNRVMQIPVAASDDEWQKAVQDQQEKSMKDAVAIH